MNAWGDNLEIEEPVSILKITLTETGQERYASLTGKEIKARFLTPNIIP